MKTHPFVSVMIPMRNEAKSIAACLDSVLAQDYPADRFEVLVIDGASSDECRRIVAEYTQRDGRVRLLDNPRGIVPTALNIGIRAGSGDVLMRVDGHTRLATDYMRTGVATLERTGADNVGGPMVPVGGGTVGDAIACVTGSRLGVGSQNHIGRVEAEVDTVYMGMYRRDVFERIGLFDEEMVRNQDDEFNYRLRKTGGRIVLNPKMRSSYQNRQTFRALAKQYAQYGFWKVRVLQKHPRQMSPRHLVPPALVLGLTVPLLSAWWLPGAAVASLPSGMVYAAAIVAVAGRLAQHRGWRLFLPMVAAFATLHLAWGAGMLLGLARFALRWFAREAPPPQLGTAADLGWQRRAAGV